MRPPGGISFSVSVIRVRASRFSCGAYAGAEGRTCCFCSRAQKLHAHTNAHATFPYSLTCQNLINFHINRTRKTVEWFTKGVPTHRIMRWCCCGLFLRCLFLLSLLPACAEIYMRKQTRANLPYSLTCHILINNRITCNRGTVEWSTKPTHAQQNFRLALL